jgi:polyadenylate-binding protein 2
MSDADKPEAIPEGEREPEHETAASEEVGLLSTRALRSESLLHDGI